jgi:hypothetical protein
MLISRILRAADHPYLFGPGGRYENNKRMKGMTLKSLAHEKALQPLFAVIGAGMVMVGAYIIRLGTKTTDINWSKQKNPAAPMNYYTDKQFKLFNPAGTDYSNRSAVRPKFE